jgi:hypothetical protein
MVNISLTWPAGSEVIHMGKKSKKSKKDKKKK